MVLVIDSSNYLSRRKRTPLTSVENSSSITTRFFASSQIITKENLNYNSSRFSTKHNSAINVQIFKIILYQYIKMSSSLLCVMIVYLLTENISETFHHQQVQHSYNEITFQLVRCHHQRNLEENQLLFKEDRQWIFFTLPLRLTKWIGIINTKAILKTTCETI